MKRTISIASALFLMGPATADPRYDWNVNGVHIVVIEATYMPDRIGFQVDADAGSSCPKGTWLSWPAQGGDTQSMQGNTAAVFALVLSAKLSKSAVDLYGKDSGCVVNFIYIR